MNLSDKKLIVFDLDGTLAESKQAIDREMAGLLDQLLRVKPVAVIGGGSYDKFKEQLIEPLDLPGDVLKNLFLFPMTGTAFYVFKNSQWEKVYENTLTDNQKAEIMDGFLRTFTEINYIHPGDLYGEEIEDRGSQVTFSALGQDAPLDKKKRWFEDNKLVRHKLAEELRYRLPNFEIREAGLTSIDVTPKGIDKKYGLEQISKQLGIPIEDMLFVGDATFHGGNDEAATHSGVEFISISGPAETKKLIQQLI